MKKIFKTVFFLVTICCISISCSDGDDETPVDPPQPPPATFTITPIENLNQGTSAINSHADVISRSSLKMNFRSYVELGETQLGIAATATPHYPRVKKMANGNYIMFINQNQHGGSCFYSISSNLKLWQSKGKIFSSYNITDSNGNPNQCLFATTDAVVLANGDILAVASYRANTPYKELPLNAGLMLRRSTDNGTSWSDPVAIYQGVNWEPYLLEVSPGVIHCYFTDSSRTNLVDKDTGTVMIVSQDNGKTWTPSFGNTPYYVIRSSHKVNGKTCYNDQMPSVIKLNGSKELAAVMETTRIENDYHISFAYSGEDGEWTHLRPDQTGPVDRVTSAFLGAAPYILQFPSGETILSYGRSSQLNLKIGNAKARNFGDSYIPFSGGFWGSIQVMNNHQLIATMPNTSKKTIMLAQVVLNHRITATRRSAVIDGSNLEWADTDQALFVGEKSQAQGVLRCAFDDENVYFLVEVLDNSIGKEDYAAIYLNPVTTDDKLTNEARRIKVSYNGIVSSESYNGSSWATADLGVTVKAEYENSKNDKGGYVAEISIPRSKLNIKSGEILVNFSLFDNEGGEDAIVNTSSTSTAKWIPINGL